MELLVIVLAVLLATFYGLMNCCRASKFRLLDIKAELGLKGFKLHIRMKRR